MNVVVIGGGFVGQLVQLAVPTARLLDWRKVAPANHLETRTGPQYLWEPIPNVPSRSFPVVTLVDGEPPTADRIMAYKRKIGKENDGGDWGLQFQHMSMGWHSDLPVPRVEYGQIVRMVDLQDHMLGMGDWTTIKYDILISTIPLPAFLELMIVGPAYREGFKADPIYMNVFNKGSGVDGMILNYIADPTNPHYRFTTTKDQSFLESLSPSSISTQTNKLVPGKIHPHNESEVLLSLLRNYHCYSFGRFATWRPDELAHETWKLIADWKSELGI